MSDEFPQSKLLRKLKGQIGEFLLQLNLGTHEAIDYVETHKGELRDAIDQIKNAIGDRETTHKLRGKLDELRLQLALGRMDSRDALVDQRGKIQHAIGEVCQEWHHLDADARELLAEKSESLQTKLNALALDLGLASIVASEDLKVKKDELTLQAKRLAEKLETGGEHAAELAGEVRDAWNDFTHRLRNLHD